MTATLPAPAGTWRSWHLHTGSLQPAALDRLVTAVVGPVIAATRSTTPRPPWFFVRYWQQGPHVRLRVADPADASAIHHALAQALLADPDGDPRQSIDADTYRAATASIAAAGEGGVPVDAGSLRAPGVYPEPYLPEYDRYGGRDLMPLSEHLFHVSSDTVLRVCADRPGPRRTMLGLEALAASCGVLPWDPAAHLVAVRDGWMRWLTQGKPGLDVADVDRAGGELAARLGPAAQTLTLAMSGEHPARWAAWCAALRTAVGVWQRELDPPSVIRIAGSHIHMTCNRLGLGAGAEAYLASALLRLYPAGTSETAVHRC